MQDSANALAGAIGWRAASEPPLSTYLKGDEVRRCAKTRDLKSDTYNKPEENHLTRAFRGIA